MNTRGGQQLALRAIVQDRSQVYVELTKPRITAMVLLTVCVGYAIAPHSTTPPMALLHVLIGAALSCSGAGALNQLIERETDSVMGRTRFRPLPSRRVAPWQALTIGVTLALGGVAYLLATTNGLTAAVDAATLVGAKLLPATGHALFWRGTKFPLRFAPVELELATTARVVRWPAIIAFTSAPIDYPLLGMCGFFQFFDARDK